MMHTNYRTYLNRNDILNESEFWNEETSRLICYETSDWSTPTHSNNNLDLRPSLLAMSPTLLHPYRLQHCRIPDEESLYSWVQHPNTISSQVPLVYLAFHGLPGGITYNDTEGSGIDELVHPFISATDTKRIIYIGACSVFSGSEGELLAEHLPEQSKSEAVVGYTEPRNFAFNTTLTNRINLYTAKYSAFLDKGKQPSLDEFITHITTNQSPSFIDFYNQEIIRYEKNGKFRTSEKHLFILNKLERYLKEKHSRTTLNFDELNIPFLTAYETYLKNDLGNHQNTYYTDLKNMRTIFSNAIRQQVVEPYTSQFFQFTLHQIPTIKGKLTTTEIDDIWKLKLVEGKAMWHARNYFLFSYYCSGMRWGDVCTLKWSNVTNDARLRYVMSKNNKQVDIKLPEKALLVLDRYRNTTVGENDYIFPLLKKGVDYSKIRLLKKSISSKNTVVDRELKNIAALAKIKTKLTFHISRHSFAYHLYLNGRDVKAVQDALYHSSLQETQKYLSELGAVEKDAALKQFFNN